MQDKKRKRLERAGWRVGTTREFLGLDDAEGAVIEIRVALDLLIRSLAVAGSTTAEIGRAIASIGSRAERARKSA